jgi:glutaminyl-tRNA synthetase
MGKEKAANFIEEIINKDLENNKNDSKVHTRFPPEPNGYLHIGHAKSICLNFGIAKKYNGSCNLRLDDSNPEKEKIEYVNSIKEDVSWLGFKWAGLYYASDYFDKLYSYAVELIKKGKAYVCDLSPDEVRKYRGTLTESGKDSPYRNRSVDENLDLFMRMKAGEFEEGSKTLRAKIDMGSANLTMRDPALYRIRKLSHYRTGDKWVIYPMYDFTHCLSDSMEGITHSICTLEFENNRPLYDWILDELEVHHPQQIEFARLNLSHTVLSKRKLLELVENKYVSGWDDPRMPTISGLRRRGYTSSAIRNFCSTIGVTKINSIIEMNLLENSIREELNKSANRVMAVLNPLKVTIENYPDGKTEELDCINNPEDKSKGTRKVPFSKVIYIERNDFQENPHRKFYRLAPKREVRLRYAYFITCKEVIKDEAGKVKELICTYDPQTKGGDAPDGRKVKGTLHWVDASNSIEAEVRLYDKLFLTRDPNKGGNYLDNFNKESLITSEKCYLEKNLKDAKIGDRYQFERLGYFCLDKDSTKDKPVFNRIVSLRDTWAKISKKQ